MTTTLSLADRWRRSWYLQRVELWLDPMPRRRRRAVLGELRANLDEAAADVGLPRAVADLGVAHPVVIDNDGMIRYGASATPSFALVDRRGIVRHYTATRLSEAELSRRIEELLAEAE